MAKSLKNFITIKCILGLTKADKIDENDTQDIKDLK